MAKHFSEFKKYETSFSFAGVHFWAKTPEQVAGKCPCGWMVESENGIDEAMIDACKGHCEAGCNPVLVGVGDVL